MFGDISCMAGRGADHSSTPIIDLRLNGESFDFSNVRTGGIDPNASDTPAFMQDACINPRSRFRLDEFGLAGIPNEISCCNDYDTTPNR